MIKNNFKYRSNFKRLLDFNAYHNFYNDNILRSINFTTSNETRQTLKNYEILFRPSDNGFSLLSKSDPKLGGPSFGGEISLVFNFKINDNTFINKTDIPFSNNLKLVFKNTQDQNDEKLHQSFFVDEECIEESDEDGVTGTIALTINSSNQFFGTEEFVTNNKTLKYSISFNARKVKFRYNFYSQSPVLDFEKYYLTDEISSFKLNESKNRLLASGKSVFSIELPEEIAAIERYSNKVFLKKEDEFFTSFSKYLPHPTPNNISFDFSEEFFYADIFIKI